MVDSITALRTVAAFFDTSDLANKAVDDLVAAGILRDRISVTDGSATSGATVNAAGTRDFWDSLKDMFLPDEDRYAYTEGLRRGGVVVSVRVDAAHYGKALEILDEEGAVDLDEREATWRSEGWTGYDAVGAGSGAVVTSSPFGDDEVIPVYEEPLLVAKRDVAQGRVRVRSYVVETPATETVILRKESVQVERKAVGRRPVAAADPMFQDRVIEAEDQAVIAKVARLKEDVTLPPTASRDERQQILDRLAAWTGDRDEALYWFNNVRIPALSNRTADQLLRGGLGAAVSEYVEGLKAGEFS